MQEKTVVNCRSEQLTKDLGYKEIIKQTLKVKLYKSLVKSILFYNSATWGLKKKEEERLNSFLKHQLRQVLNVKYLASISNVQLYKQTGEDTLSLEILQNKWKLFGHLLRSHPATLGQKVMDYYYFESGIQRNFMEDE